MHGGEDGAPSGIRVPRITHALLCSAR